MEDNMSVCTNIFSSKAAYLNRAADFIELANEERAAAIDMNTTITAIAAYSLAAIALAFAVGIALSANAAKFGILTVQSYVLPVVTAYALLQFISVALIIYTLWKRSSHLANALEHEKLAAECNSKAADFPPWNGMGLISGLFSLLFSRGNPVTNFGAGTLSGRRE